MKRLFKAILLSLVAIILLSMPVMAAVSYRATYTIVETNGTAYDMLPTSVAVDNQWLVDNGFMQADTLDTRIETLSGLVRPHMVVDDRTLTSTPVPASSQTNLYFTTANTDLTSLDIIAGYDGYVTTDDDASLELAADGEIEIDAYIDTTDTNFTFVEQKRAATSIPITDTDEISGVVYFDEPVDVSPAGLGAWTDIDISDYVPSYATGAVVHLYTSNVAEIIGVRINGSAQNLLGDVYGHLWTMVGIDANDIFEGYIEAATCYIYLVGFTGSGVTYNVVADDISLAAALAWTDIDLSVEAPDAIGVIVAVDNTDAGNERNYGLRKKGSGDARIDDIVRDGWFYGIVGCDASQIIQGYVETLTVDFYLVGYITANFVLNTNGTDKSPAAGFGAWTDMDCSGDVPVGTNYIIFEVVSPSATYGFRRNGSAQDIRPTLVEHCWAVVECDSDRIVEYWAQNATVDFYIIGYTQGYIDDPYQSRVIADSVTSGEYVVNHSLNANQYDFSDYNTYTTVAVSMGGGLVPVVLLDEEELTAAVASVTFSGIDTLVSDWDTIAGVTSRHLVVVVNAAATGAVTSRFIRYRFNGDVAANYNVQFVGGSGAGATSFAETGVTWGRAWEINGQVYPNGMGGGTIIIPHAFNSTNHKSALSFGGGSEYGASVIQCRWTNNNAITSILLEVQNDTAVAGSTFWLGVVDERYLVEEDLLVAPGAIDFNNIPQDGHDLCVIGYSRGTLAAVEDELVLELNADGVAASYNTQRLTGTAGATGAATANNALIAYTTGDNATANAYGAFVGFINQYAEATNYPHYLTLNGYHETTGATSRVGAYSGRYNAAVGAITRVEIYGSGAANLATGSLFSLYRVPRTVIDRQELTAPAATITFNNIPQGYEVLQLNIYGRSSDAIPIEDDVNISFNTDVVAANYDTQQLSGTGAVVAAARSAADLILMKVPAAGEGANEFGGGIVTIPNYAKADRHKHYYSIDGTNENQVVIRSMRWEDTSAITRIDLTLASAANFIAGTIVELVGIFPQDVHAIEVEGNLYGISDGNNLSVPDVTTDWQYGLNNSVPYATSIEQSGAGLNFDGTVNAEINCGAIHNAATKLWVSLWFKLDNNFNNTVSADQALWGKRLGGADYITCHLESAGGGGGQLRLQKLTGGVADFTIDSTQTSWERNVWYHVITSISSANGVRMIVDNGVAVTDADTSAICNGGNLYFGDAGIVVDSIFGVEANIAVGTDDLTVAEELGLYNGVIPSDAVNIWYADEGTGVNIIDYGTGGNNGTAGVACTWVGSGGMGNNNALKRLWYQPNTMIIGTDLPDRTENDQDGVFTFGTNPAGVGVSLGGMVSVGQPAPGSLPTDPARDILPETPVSDWFIEPAVGTTLLNNPLRPFVTMWSDNSELTEIQCWRIYALALILMITVATAMSVGRHQGITAIAASVAILGAVVMTIYPVWTLVFAIGMFIGGLVMERAPSL